MPRSAASSSIVGHREPFLLSSLAHAALLLLLLLRLSCSLAGAEPSHPLLLPPCEPEQASALLRLKASLLPSGDDDHAASSSSSCAAALGSWRNDTEDHDCCRWERVSCGYVPGYAAGGQVIALDLSNCACGGGAPLDDAAALFSLPSLTHVNRTCNDGSSSKSELRQDLQQVLEEGPAVQQVNPHHYFDLVMAEEVGETTTRRWMRTLLWAVLALGLYPKYNPLRSPRGQMAPNPVAIVPAEQEDE